MKRLITFVFVIAIFLFNIVVHAECNDEELNEIMNNFEVGLVTDEENLQEANSLRAENEQYGYIIIFQPFTDKVDIKVSDNKNKKYEVDYHNKLGALYFGSYFVDEYKEYKIEVYGNYNSTCSGELLLSNRYKAPKFNEFSLSEYCDNNPNDEMCSPIYDTSDKTTEEIEKIIEDNKTSNLTTQEKILTFIKKNWYFVVVPILIISIIYIVIIRNYKKKESNR